ncbi:cell wall metabolism sensor histidine kinase WalK [Sphingomonas bacterium]|uniref:sensor histidine kinase n=1 Tax=Sphingomonas bacterium TaxID=1895847 RepID=UPI0020C60F83|nr:HAMP domain-containing sensor histidine kinase [Sphingomonas bacterium]
MKPGLIKRYLPRSLILRILLVEFVAIAGVVVIVAVLLVSILHQTTALYQDRALLDQARTIALGLSEGLAEHRIEESSAILPAYSSTYDGRAFVVVDGAGRAAIASRYAERVPWRQAPRRPTPQPFRAGTFVGVSLPVSIGGEAFWVVVSQDEARPGAILDDVERALLLRYVALLVPILLLLPLVNSLLIRRLVAAVRTVSAHATQIDARTLDIRLDDTDLPAEVLPLVQATNALIARLEESFAQQSQFIANVVHELRTPLATLRIRLDGVGDADVREAAVRQVDRLSHVVGQLSDLAALERVPDGAVERFDLALLAVETIAAVVEQEMARDHEIGLDAPDEAVFVTANRVLIGLALSNLVTNAFRHTPAGTTVGVSVAVDGTLTVVDDGPGITAKSPDLLTRRFWRADHGRSDSAGLGLAIVDRVARAHGAALSIRNRPGGGAAFSILLSGAEQRG